MPARRTFDEWLPVMTAAERQRWESINRQLDALRADYKRLTAVRRRMVWRFRHRARKAGG